MSEFSGDHYRKPLPGDRLVIPARLMGEVIDTVRQVRGGQTKGPGALGFPLPSQTVAKVRNDSGADRDRFGVLGIAGVRITPTDNLNDFLNRPLLSGVTPTTDHAGSFVILLEPLAAGQIGRAVVSGLAVARVAVTTATADYQFVQAQDGDPAAVELVEFGPARLLWREGGTDVTEWALIRLGDGSPGAAAGNGGGTLSGCKVTRSSSLSLPHNTLVTVDWNSELFDTGGYHDNAVNPSRLTIPATGVYLVGFAITLFDFGNFNGRYRRITASITKNGSPFLQGVQRVEDTTNECANLTPRGSTIASLSSGDYLQFAVSQQNAGSLTVSLSAGEASNSFWIMRLT